jgi:hypothetical protein
MYHGWAGRGGADWWRVGHFGRGLSVLGLAGSVRKFPGFDDCIALYRAVVKKLVANAVSGSPGASLV